MLIHVKLYASLRRYRPELALGQACDVDLPDGSTVEKLVLEELRLPSNEVAITLVNGIQQPRDCALNDGDTVALWPPIAGG
jgi:sulfur carrier protein